MINHTKSDYIPLGICLWHHFGTAVITVNTLSGYSRVLMTFKKVFVA